MVSQRQPLSPLSLEQEELRALSRTVAEIHWLLIILILLFVIFGGERDAGEEHLAISAGLVFYSLIVMGMRYANVHRRESRWKLALESWLMIALITWVLNFTGGIESPLFNTYLLPVVMAALTLGKITTLAETGLIAACAVYLAGGPEGSERLLTLSFAGGLAAQLAPVLLVAYVTSMFSADIRYGIGQGRLLAETDHLTGLFNPKGFAIAASRLFAQAVRYSRPVSLLMIDCDGLQSINDAQGHEMGNQVLRRISETVLAEMRYADVAARFGGDEFVVLLNETPVKGALGVAERVRASVASGLLHIDGVRVNTTVSIGVASFPDDGRSVDALVASAERALREAKGQGANRVHRLEPAARAA